jgi:predicted DNA-binding protein with PD1-like motif
MNRSRLKSTFMLHFQNETNLQAGTNRIITGENILPSLVTGIGAVPQARRVYYGQSAAKCIDLKRSMGIFTFSGNIRIKGGTPFEQMRASLTDEKEAERADIWSPTASKCSPTSSIAKPAWQRGIHAHARRIHALRS